MKVLLIEDNPNIANQVMEMLEAHGWILDYAATGNQGIELALSQPFDVILLDLNLPDIDGIEVCRVIKSEAMQEIPVLMLTARDAFEHKAEGFKTGADDYLTKPFDLRELVLRCQALSKRNTLHKEKKVTLGPLLIDVNTKQVFRQGSLIHLTKIGFSILNKLVDSYPLPVTKEALIHAVWDDEMPDSDPLKSHIYSLRLSLDRPFDYALVHTIKDVGYKLEIREEL